ncbi:hypothetical protein B0H11DRAFT_2057856 [Mycena galericulata]|nr:hypothetical protein B0H11DRAFT_2057856 [Mycena galericulata]
MRRGFLNKPRKSSTTNTDPKSDAWVARVRVDMLPYFFDRNKEKKTAPESKAEDTERPERDERDETKGKSNTQPCDAPPLDLHRPPQWVLDDHSKKDEKRFIFRHWPRDPNGPGIMYDRDVPGKTTPNGIRYWGATLYDFYTWHRFPDNPVFLSQSSGSRLTATMRAAGELKTAEPEILWADREADPEQLVLPIEIARDIQPQEVHVGVPGRSRSVRGKEHARAVEVPLPDPAPNAYYDITNIVPENYPGPWPLVPFSQPTLSKLETLIPYTLLPQTLIVHDPWKLLTMPGELDADAGTDWMDMPDITYTYELAPITDAGLRKSKHQHEVFDSRIGGADFILQTPADEDGMCTPPLRIKVPPYPRKEVTPAAHLYLSPNSKAGDGNHSVVYHAEWELPRSLLVPDVMCHACIAKELNETDLEKVISDALEKAGEKPDARAHVTEEMSVEPEIVVDVSRGAQKGHKDKTLPDIRVLAEGRVERTRTYNGPILEASTGVAWQTPGRGDNCAHISYRPMLFSQGSQRPPTARVRVCAKLSHEHDSHLAREAKVYQAFPAHLSEHWSGYNLVRPSREPVPVGAVVPQFYGYYLPSEDARKRADGAYLSAVMLLENCGVPLDPAVLSPDEEKECWSLLYRLHHAGWTHESVAARNIVVQPGPLTSPQGWIRGSTMEQAATKSFRIIDFGRSLYCGAEEEGKESAEAEELYREAGHARSR